MMKLTFGGIHWPQISVAVPGFVLRRTPSATEGYVLRPSSMQAVRYYPLVSVHQMIAWLVSPYRKTGQLINSDVVFTSESLADLCSQSFHWARVAE